MPAIGITSLATLVSAPTGCVLNEVTQEDSKQVKTIKSITGITVQAAVIPMIETKITVKGKGKPALAAIAATASVTAGTVVQTEMQIDESNTDFPDFSITALKWVNA
jgi:uncharacterized protein YcfJ